MFKTVLGDEAEHPNRADRRHDAPLAFRPEDAGQRLGLGRTTTYAEIASGRLRSFRVGKRRLVPASALVEYIEDRLAEEEGS